MNLDTETPCNALKEDGYNSLYEAIFDMLFNALCQIGLEKAPSVFCHCNIEHAESEAQIELAALAA